MPIGYRSTLMAGETVRIYASMFGTPPPNTNVIGGHIQLDVFDRFGVHQNGGWDIYAETYGVVQFTSQRDDKYFVQIRNDFAVGDYTLSLLETVTPEMSPDRILQAIDHGSRVEDREISVYFAPEGESSLGYTSVGFNAYQISRFQAAFDIIESLIDVEFNIVDNRIDADFDLYLDQEILGGSNTLGQFGLPDSFLGAGQGNFNATFMDDVEGGNLEAGAEGFFVILHELLHGLGLAHPHETMGAAIALYDVGALRYHQLVELDQAVYTIQSYDRGWGTGPANQATQGSNDFGHAMSQWRLMWRRYSSNTGQIQRRLRATRCIP